VSILFPEVNVCSLFHLGFNEGKLKIYDMTNFMKPTGNFKSKMYCIMFTFSVSVGKPQIRSVAMVIPGTLKKIHTENNCLYNHE
jgi:hypothetical protein